MPPMAGEGWCPGLPVKATWLLLDQTGSLGEHSVLWVLFLCFIATLFGTYVGIGAPTCPNSLSWLSPPALS